MYPLVASRTSPTTDLARSPGMCPDWESQAHAQFTEPQQPGLHLLLDLGQREGSRGLWAKLAICLSL